MSRLMDIRVAVDDQQAVSIAKQTAYESDNLAAVCDIARNAIYKLREVDPARLERMLKREFNATITFGPDKARGKVTKGHAPDPAPVADENHRFNWAP